MAEITKATNSPSCGSMLPPHNSTLPALFAGEALGAFDACYIKASDGLVYKSTGAAANAAAKVRGYASRKCNTGDPCTLWFDIEVQYADATMTVGGNLFLSGTVAGGLADAASTGGTAAIGFAVTSSRAYLYQSNY